MDSKIVLFKNHVGPPKKRKRVISSCSNCRKKKSRCDKSRPVCMACVKANVTGSCSYPEPDWKKAQTVDTGNYAAAASIPMAHIQIQKEPSPSDQQPIIKTQPPQPQSQHHTLPQPQLQSQPQPQPQLQSQYCQHQLPLPQNHHQQYNLYSQHSISNVRPPNGIFPQTYQLSPFPTPQPPQHSPQSNYDLNEELFKLRQKVENLESNLKQGGDSNSSRQNFARSLEPDAYMSFFEYDEPVQIRAGRLIASAPLSLSSIYKSDPFMKVLLYKIRKEKKKLSYSWQHKKLKSSELVKQIIIEDKNSMIKTVDEKFKATLIENENLDDINSSGHKKDQKESQFLNMQKLNYESETIMKIEEVLPEEKLIWVLVDRFFNGILAAAMPFLSEALLREKIEEIIGPRSDHKEKVKEITISRRFDFAYMGILLIILRLTYISVVKTSNNTPQEKYILETPIGSNVINVAQMCLNQFKLLRRGALPIIQCCMMMRYYHKYAPEDGDGSDGGDSEVFLGMLLQMGNSIGLNRDMTNSVSLRSKDRVANLWRMLWHEIATLDLRQSLSLGNPILIDERFCDTKLPIIEATGARTLNNFEIHQSIVRKFELNNEVNTHLRSILTDVLTIKQRVKINDLLVKLSDLEKFLYKNFKTLENILNLKNFTIQDTITKVFKFINYVELKSSLYVIYYHMFLKDKRNNFQLLMKMLEIAMELNPLAYFMLTTNNEKTNYFETVFGPGSQLLILPHIIPALQKTHQIHSSLISRTLDIKFNYTDYPHMKILDKIREALFSRYQIVHDGYQSLSSNYFHAWRTTKGVHFIMNLLKDEDNSIWDKMSAVNKECEAECPSDDVNHFKQYPQLNELLVLSQEQLEEVLEIVSTSSFDETILSLLNKKKKASKRTHPMQYGPTEQSSLQPAQQSFQRVSPSISKLLQDPVPEMPHLQQSTPSAGSAHSDIQSSKSDNEFHLSKNAMTNTEIDRLWIQMMASNTFGNLRDASTDGIQQQDDNQGNPEDGDPMNDPIQNQVRNNTGVSNQDPNNGATGVNINVILANNGNGNSNVNSDAAIGAFGSLDLEKLINDTSPYDMFGDIPFYNDL